MRFDIITIFPKIFDSYFSESVLKRAREKKLVDIRVHDLRKFARGEYRKLDDRPYGGGAGMVLVAEPILQAAESIKKSKKSKIVILSAKGKQFNQKIAGDWSKKFNHIILISGRYEGIDERVRRALKAEEISIGPYVLTDGDAAAMVIVSAVARLLPGVIKLESLAEESHGNLLLKKEAGFSAEGLEYPHYTRPEVIFWNRKKYRVPKVLLSGDHRRIGAWREGKKKKTARQ
jgi:tRNA (guanine-N1)-methyltransferase